MLHQVRHKSDPARVLSSCGYISQKARIANVWLGVAKTNPQFSTSVNHMDDKTTPYDLLYLGLCCEYNVNNINIHDIANI